jgi:hypothetical protein
MRLALILAPTLLPLLAACTTTTTKDGVDGSHKNAIVAEEVHRRVAELRFLHGDELLHSMARLVAFGDVASEDIRAGAKSDDWLTRASLAWVMGSSGDRRYIPDLRPMLADKEAGVRFEAASALVELGDGAGFQVLVEGLADADIRNRYKCFESLRRATGQDFGYRHDAAPEDRRASVARWVDWLQGLHASAL